MPRKARRLNPSQGCLLTETRVTSTGQVRRSTKPASDLKLWADLVVAARSGATLHLRSVQCWTRGCVSAAPGSLRPESPDAH